jgi:ABC-type transport system involved in multi-copper enzyme maturation permease subunit
MRSLLRSELVKLASTRMVLWLLLGSLAVTVLSTWSTVANVGAESISGDLREQMFYLLAAVNLPVFAVVLGIRSITDEFRYGTVVVTVLGQQRRGRLLVAKAAVAAVAAAVVSAASVALMTGLALLLSAKAHGGLQVTVGDVGAMVGLVLGAAVWAVLGVAVGTLVRQQVAAVVGGVVWVLVVENLGGGLLGAAASYLPGQAVQAMAQLPGGLSTPAAAAVLAGYAALLGTAARMSLVHRDV